MAEILILKLMVVVNVTLIVIGLELGLDYRLNRCLD